MSSDLFLKHTKKKVFKDPVLGSVSVEYRIISELIDSREMQRLRRIRQLSGVAMVFHTAEHSRFPHALGAYEISRIIIEEVAEVRARLTKREELIFLISALLHDLGHGPFSHSFEHAFSLSHEEMTCRIIANPNSEVNAILSRHDLVTDIINVISHQHKYPIIESLISSQIDVDRLDYLPRDAYFTGATYGQIDLSRLIRNITIHNDTVAFNSKAVHTLENYLMSRYHMYWQVYYHAKARSYEIILEGIYKRLLDLSEEVAIKDIAKDLIAVFKQNDVDAYISIDDDYINGLVKKLTVCNDIVLEELANAFLNRKLFKCYIEAPYPDISKLYPEGLQKYFYKEENIFLQAYLEDNDSDIKSIKIKTGDKIVSLDEYSPIVANLLLNGNKQERRVYIWENFKKF